MQQTIPAVGSYATRPNHTMPAMLQSFLRFKFFWLFVIVLAVFMAFIFFRPKGATTGKGRGPAYDLIFGVNTFNPNLEATAYIAPYVIDGVLYVECQKLPANEGTSHTWVTFYRYYSQTGEVVQLPSPTPDELKNIATKQTYVFAATRGIKLYTEEQSPDGYTLAGPGWVTVDPISNAIGNVTLFLMTGGFENIKKRELAPRLSHGRLSLAMQYQQPVFNNEADMAFLLGWVMPERTAGSNKR